MPSQADRDKPRYFVTVDAVVFTVRDQVLQLLLIKRQNPPFANSWALPGGYVEEKEDLEEAVLRELGEETDVRGIFLEQVGAFGDVKRDPRGRTITVAFMALIDASRITLQAKTDALQASWFPIKSLPALAFDHAKIIERGLGALRSAIVDRPIAFQLLGSEFTLTQLQNVHEAVLGTKLDKRNFRKKVLQSGHVVPTTKIYQSGPHRPAKLFRFAR